jgi:hypothetical protein
LKSIGGVPPQEKLFCRLLLGFEIQKERYRADNKMREVEWVGKVDDIPDDDDDNYMDEL